MGSPPRGTCKWNWKIFGKLEMGVISIRFRPTYPKNLTLGGSHFVSQYFLVVLSQNEKKLDVSQITVLEAEKSAPNTKKIYFTSPKSSSTRVSPGFNLRKHTSPSESISLRFEFITRGLAHSQRTNRTIQKFEIQKGKSVNLPEEH